MPLIHGYADFAFVMLSGAKLTGQRGFTCADHGWRIATFEVTADPTRREGQILTVTTEPSAQDCAKATCIIRLAPEPGAEVALA